MIRVENLSKEYDFPTGRGAPIVAANQLSLEVASGEIFGLVGPNGAGKTTTLKMICGLVVPTSGRVSVNGVDVERQPEEAQRHLGYLADFFSLYDDLKVWEYLDYFARAYKMDRYLISKRVDELIERLDLKTKRDAMIGGLSRGMKQRVGLGRAIVHDPPLLVLDEPAAGLDPKARVELKELLRELQRGGKTIFITSHILSDLEEICSSIAIIEKGRLLRIGRLEDVMREGKAERRIRIRLAAPGFAKDVGPKGPTPYEWLGARSGVSSVAMVNAEMTFSFTGSDLELAELVRAFIAAGALVCGVEELTETLEELYSRVSSDEVM
jgi:ABC-2 type transport system ATP-binding protein